MVTADEPEHADDSVLDSIDRSDIGAEDGAALEAAVDTITHAIGLLNGLIADERAKARPDAAAIARWDEAIGACVRDRKSLRVGDVTRLAQVRARYEALIGAIEDGRA